MNIKQDPIQDVSIVPKLVMHMRTSVVVLILVTMPTINLTKISSTLFAAIFKTY